MEQLCMWGGTALRMLLAGLIAVTPGVLGWLAIFAIWMAFRRVGGGDALRKLRHQGSKAPTPTAVSN